MKPIKIEMEGFGPYLSPITINFEDLPNNLTLITGNTGSGKTTIFDAICCALFGDPSGKSRSFSQMRSETASDKQKTSVKFVFELRGKRYQIERSPSYLKKKRNGEGYTKTSPKAELIMPDGEIISKTLSVNEKIKEILGIEKDEFRQIVMIAQNDFMAMIKGTGKDQEEIFNRIFNASLFENFAIELRRLKNESQNKLNNIVQNIINTVDSAGFNYKEEELNSNFINTKYLEELINHEYVQLREKESGLIRTSREDRENLEKHNLKIKQSENLIQQFNELNKLKDNLVFLNSQHEKIKQTKKAINKAETARDLVSAQYNQVKILNQSMSDLKSNLSENQFRLISLEETKEILQKELSHFSQETLDQIRMEYLKAKEELPQYQQLKNLENNFQFQKKTFQKTKLKIQQLESQLQNIQLEIDDIVVFPESQFEDKLKNIEYKRYINDDQFCQFNKLWKEANSFNEDLKKAIILKDTVEELYQKQQFSMEAYQSAYNSYIRNQAAFLAQDLKQGEPCPVCGSTSHPHPAQATGKIVTQDELQLLEERSQSDKAECEKELRLLNISINSVELNSEQLAQNYNKLTSIFTENEQNTIGKFLDQTQQLIKFFMESEILDANYMDGKYYDVFNCFQEVSDRLIDKNKRIKLEQENCLKDKQNNIRLIHKKNQLEEKKIQLEKDYTTISKEKEDGFKLILELQSNLNTLKKNLNYDNFETANKHYSELFQKYENYNQAFTKAKTQVQENGQESDRIHGSIAMLTEKLEKTKTELQKAQVKLQECLNKANLTDIQDYQNTIIEPVKLQQLKKRIEDFNTKKIKIQERFDYLDQQLENSATRF